MAKKQKYEKSFFIKMNMQNPPKPKSMDWYVRKASSDSIPKHTVCGYEFTEDRRDDSFGLAEGFSEELNFRMAFLPEEGHYWVSRDFSGQELRILANIAMEQTWIKTFLSNGDPHQATAIALWGEENYNKEKRKDAKAINFGIIYGQTAESLAVDLNISVAEAQSYLDAFFEKLPNIKLYLDKCIREAISTKSISNIYGRKRRMKNYITEYGQLRSLGKRKSYNHPIQSLGAEIMKIALIKLYDNILSVGKYDGRVFFMNTIHDEANLSVEYDLINEIAYLSGKLMEHKISGYPVPITTGLEIGHSMGLTWKFEQDEETLELTPVLIKSFTEV